jgi:hypothetical protein
VALPSANRALARRGLVEIRSTDRAAARISVTHGGRQVASVRAQLRRGSNRVRLRYPNNGGVHQVQVTARRGEQIAIHRLTVIPARWLTDRVVTRLALDASDSDVGWSEGPADCRRSGPVSFLCRQRATYGDEEEYTGELSSFRLREDGWVEFRRLRPELAGEIYRLLEPR